MLYFLISMISCIFIHSCVQGSFEDDFNLVEVEGVVVKGSLFYECKRLYEDYRQYGICTDEYQIPQNIHFIWLGSPLPKRCAELIESWRLFHPDWNIKVWTDQDVDSFNLINKAAFKKASNYGQKSDIWRYEILYRYGGLYVDTDFECLAKFDELHKSCEFYAGIGRDGIAVYNGLIGSRPNHPIIFACINQLKPSSRQRNYEQIMRETGPYSLGKIIESYGSKCMIGTVAIFPPIYFYPFPGHYRNDSSKDPCDFITSESMAIHYWACSWQK